MVLVAIAALFVGLIGGVLTGTVMERRRSVTAASRPGQGAGSVNEVAKLRDALDALATGVMVVDPAGETLVRNRAATTLDGALHSDVLLNEALEQHLQAALAGDERRQVLDLHGPPRKVLVVSARPLPDGGALATIDDITERARLDAVRTDFVANMSHELRTPVGALAILAETLSESDEPEVIDRLSRKMVDEAHRVARTIDDLLELSRIELGGQAVSEQVIVMDLVQDAIERVRPLAEGQGIGIVAGVVDRSLTLLGDRRQLFSAVGNLLENAVKYSEPGQQVEVEASRAGGSVEVRVIDHGVGIPAKDLARVFERFYRVDRARSRETGGTGLGLAIVRHVATNHGGDVTVESVEGEGSTFRFRVPCPPTRSGLEQDTA